MEGRKGFARVSSKEPNENRQREIFRAFMGANGYVIAASPVSPIGLSGVLPRNPAVSHSLRHFRDNRFVEHRYL